jgi:hypothetical protein
MKRGECERMFYSHNEKGFKLLVVPRINPTVARANEPRDYSHSVLTAEAGCIDDAV